ncbi:MAG: hypothetical protein RMA76_05650 [Deltaproteobacteria bacterium]|jgi:hypothetical protein
MRFAVPLAALLTAGLLGCSSDDPTCAPKVVVTELECQTAQDCIDEGFSNLTCLDGRCLRACTEDSDCVIDRDELDEACVNVGDPQPQIPICENLRCRTGCPTNACGAGQECVEGRCAFHYESFEIRDGETFVDLTTLGFVAPQADPNEPNIANPLTKIATLGVAGCTLGDERCAGTASLGNNFVWLRYRAASPKGQADTSFTCKACACCLDCLANPPPSGQNVTLATCPGAPDRLWSLPQPLSCPATPPSECSSVCTACDACPNAPPDTIGDRLVSCEAQAAGRACTVCQDCDTSVAMCRNTTCGGPCANPNSTECGMCVDTMCLTANVCTDCISCGESANCRAAMMSTAECADFRNRCLALGDDGCYPTPRNYDRAQLFDLEQALTSPAIDLSAAGPMQLRFDYVGFNVGVTFKVAEQGTDPAQWETAPQEVVVQFCGANCGQDSSWVDGTLVDGSRAVFPPTSRRDNGLTLGSQSTLDWRAGRVVVTIPDAVKTATFRYRFLPALSDGASVGIDEIYVRPAE